LARPPAVQREDQRATVLGTDPELLHKRGLARPGQPVDEQRPWATVSQQCLKASKLGVTTDEDAIDRSSSGRAHLHGYLRIREERNTSGARHGRDISGFPHHLVINSGLARSSLPGRHISTVRPFLGGNGGAADDR
jgi:hypothetical protein